MQYTEHRTIYWSSSNYMVITVERITLVQPINVCASMYRNRYTEYTRGGNRVYIPEL